MFFKKSEPKIQISEESKQLKKSIEHQSKLLSSLSKNDGTLTGQIKSYEYAFLVADPPLRNAVSHELKLAELYIKVEQYDKAWRYLNRMYFNHMKEETRDAFWKIRDLQARILKKEGKYSEAVKMYLLKYAEKTCDYDSQKDMILKDIKPCANKLGWDDKQLDALLRLMKKECGKFSSSRVIEKYRKML